MSHPKREVQADGPEDKSVRRWITESAPAKLNLSLRIHGRLPSGLHALQSLVTFADWGDQVRVGLEAGPASAPRVTCHCPASPWLSGPDNLAARAASRLLAHGGHPDAVRIVIDKQIPVAAGLGGGSSDAAATLRAVAQLTNRVPGPPLTPIARELGADVPVCLLGRPAWVTGWGEHVHPIASLPRLAICLVMPALRVPTAEIFAAYHAPAFEMGPVTAGPPPIPTDLAGVAALCDNDLWPVVRARHPELASLQRELAGQSPLAVSMTGSGPTLFGLFETLADAEAAANALARPGVTTRAILTTRREGDQAVLGGVP